MTGEGMTEAERAYLIEEIRRLRLAREQLNELEARRALREQPATPVDDDVFDPPGPA